MYVLGGFKSKYNRSKIDIIAAILFTVKDRSLGKTKIKYSAFLSPAQIREYLAELVTRGLLSYNETTKTFQSTELGKTFLQLYEKMTGIGRPG